MPTVQFQTILFIPSAGAKIGSGKILHLPKNASAELPTRGLNMVTGTMNGLRFRAPLEPDGEGSHWFKVDDELCSALGIEVGDSVTVEVEPAKVWPEPPVPSDLLAAVELNARAHAAWTDITTMARWDWVRWFESVKLPETQRERPAKLCSMLAAGKRRPCCFNRAMRTHPRSATPL